MSNNPRLVVKKDLKEQISKLYLSLRESDDKLKETNDNLEVIEGDYLKLKRKVESITKNNLFLGLFSAFRLWRQERRK